MLLRFRCLLAPCRGLMQEKRQSKVSNVGDTGQGNLLAVSKEQLGRELGSQLLFHSCASPTLTALGLLIIRVNEMNAFLTVQDEMWHCWPLEVADVQLWAPSLLGQGCHFFLKIPHPWNSLPPAAVSDRSPYTAYSDHSVTLASVPVPHGSPLWWVRELLWLSS